MTRKVFSTKKMVTFISSPARFFSSRKSWLYPWKTQQWFSCSNIQFHNSDRKLVPADENNYNLHCVIGTEEDPKDYEFKSVTPYYRVVNLLETHEPEVNVLYLIVK